MSLEYINKHGRIRNLSKEAEIVSNIVIDDWIDNNIIIDTHDIEMVIRDVFLSMRLLEEYDEALDITRYSEEMAKRIVSIFVDKKYISEANQKLAIEIASEEISVRMSIELG